MLSIPFIARRPFQDAGNNDTQVANCAGFVPNGNCSANSLWAMTGSDWSSFPFQASITKRNPSGYDFAGGTTFTYQALSSVNTKVVQSSTLTTLGVQQRTDRSVTNCNCSSYGDASSNCFTNCNCNCACACACACACDCVGRC